MGSGFQIFWSQEPYTLLKIIEDPKKLLFIWTVSDNINHTRNFNRKKFKVFINSFKNNNEPILT